MALQHPPPELEYVLTDTGASIIVVEPGLKDRLAELAKKHNLRLLETTQLWSTASILAAAKTAEEDAAEAPLLKINSNRRAMILYTSGTTSKPKGVVTTHDNIAAQIQALVEAWEWSADDRIIHMLPLHHIHGIINVLCCAMWSGACCEFLPKFDAEIVWQRISSGEMTLLMAVPTIYARLIAAWEQASKDQQQAWTEGSSQLRLMVSGSAALPVSTLQTWQNITKHVLLERYGMTEIGMALSNSYREDRVPGHVGKPLPRVEVRRLAEDGSAAADDVPAELQVRGPAVFIEYWGKPEATREAFEDGWFKTGDVMVVEQGQYRILGRSSVDIIKTGGYKVSALEIEEVLREHPRIAECAVVGLEDPDWGQRVAACCVLSDAEPLEIESLRAWTKERLATYKSPHALIVVDKLPRNAMGKVQKKAVVELFEGTSDS